MGSEAVSAASAAYNAEERLAGPSRLSSAASREQKVKVGKTVDVTFRGAMIVGDVMFAPGTYELQHRGHGTAHFMRFEALTRTVKGHMLPSGRVYELACQLVTLPRTSRKTTLQIVSEDAGQRLRRLEIRGENVAHVF